MNSKRWFAELHGPAVCEDPNSLRLFSSLSLVNARLRLHGVSSYGRSRRPKPRGRDNFPLGA
ncbi:hypothetical protein D1O30_20830 [Methylocystis hirsuta]|uniref:Uncharacterized protein n=1 Tax=Methylocystis hirsuta TaxID=369798 RepID=A0A3M9XIL7_9HYPH|nr:hypothetical protein D1O30_20830 [Methylocystis hirsuta]